VPRTAILDDLQQLVRAYGVLAGTCDHERALIGPISREWIASEVEHPVAMSALPQALFHTQRGRDLLATALFPDQDIDPGNIDPATLDLPKLFADRYINSNRIPKLEPRLNCAVLVANLLLGVRLYGNHGKGVPEITHELIVAAMLQDALDKPYLFGALSSAEYEIVDCQYVKTWFGPTVSLLAWQIREVLLDFAEAKDEADQAGAGIPAARITNALAAILASRLRLTARAAGDRVVSFLDAARFHELQQAGIDPAADFPEREALTQDYILARAALALPGVDHYALREPLRTTLIIAVGDALEDDSKRDRLSGRRGKAVHELHMNLPVMEYYVASESPNALETVHLASLEMMRSLDKGRRKSLNTMIAHAFRIAAFAERVLGDELEPLVVTLAMLHDVVEDGSVRVTGYDHSLQKLMFRFGAPIAAMVSELTDSGVKTAGAHKARMTYEQPHLISPEDQYNVNRFTELDLRPSDGRQPYTLSGIVIKLLDTVVSLEEGIRDPELMTDWWRHSGARIFWANYQRGSIVHPLIERLVIELKHSRTDPSYAQRPHRITQGRLKAGMALLETTLNYLDMYATQNLAILADEYQLDERQREFLIRSFTNPNITQEQFTSLVLDTLLTEERIQHSVDGGRVPARCYVAAFAKSAGPDDCHDFSTLLSYRLNALRRRSIREELGVNTPERIDALALRHAQVLSMYDSKMASTELKSVPLNKQGFP